MTRSSMSGHPVRETKTKDYRYIKALLDGPDPLTQDLDDLKRHLTASSGTKFVAYATQINPKLLPHSMYTERAHPPYESHSIVTTHLRASRQQLGSRNGKMDTYTT